MCLCFNCSWNITGGCGCSISLCLCFTCSEETPWMIGLSRSTTKPIRLRMTLEKPDLLLDWVCWSAVERFNASAKAGCYDFIKALWEISMRMKLHRWCVIEPLNAVLILKKKNKIKYWPISQIQPNVTYCFDRSLASSTVLNFSFLYEMHLSRMFLVLIIDLTYLR